MTQPFLLKHFFVGFLLFTRFSKIYNHFLDTIKLFCSSKMLFYTSVHQLHSKLFCSVSPPLNYFLLLIFTSNCISSRIHASFEHFFIVSEFCFPEGKISRARIRCMLLRANFNSSALVSRGIFLYVQKQKCLKEASSSVIHTNTKCS